MEALAVLGLASNIVQFLELSGRLINGGIELYRAADGAISSNRILEDVTRDLGQLCDALLPGALSSYPDESEITILSLCKSCRTLGQQLLVILEDLKVKGKGKGLQSARQALRAAWKGREIQKYEKQLASYRSQIIVHLLKLLVHQQNLNSNNHFAMAKTMTNVAEMLHRLKDGQDRLGLTVTCEVSDLKDQIVTRLYNSIQSSTDHETLIPEGLSLDLSHLHNEASSLFKQLSVIESLQFPKIEEREQHVKSAHTATFEWLFNIGNQPGNPDGGTPILEWLENGSGVFWISGKAGSGKSTLMKFLYQHRKTRLALRHWAGAQKLFIARFFSWHAGTPMQKNLQGLFQTLLFNILRQDPDLIQSVCPLRWNEKLRVKDSWSFDEIFQAFQLLKTKQLNARFCFFIDGLDEFEGDYIDLVNHINDLTSSHAIKICFSSRPWAIFEHAYTTSAFIIRVHDLTQDDIKRFVTDRLLVDTKFFRLEQTDESHNDLIREIVERSNGVFLWVYLVVKSLRRGIANLDTISELQAEIRAIPMELEEFFQQIFDGIERKYHQHAARLYLIRLVCETSPTAADICMFAENHPNFALTHEHVFAKYDSPAIVRTTQIRVLARCKDLLEFDDQGCLHFLHRTVKAFLETKTIQDLLLERAGHDFDPDQFMCNSMISQISLSTQSMVMMTPIPLRHFESAAATFWFHARKVDDRQQLDHRLLGILDVSHWRYSGLQSSLGFGERHYEGWLADQLIGHQTPSFLVRGIDTGIEVMTENGVVIRRPPLDIALRDMESQRRLEMVVTLLDAGADPNEFLPLTHESLDSDGSSNTVWEAFLEQLLETSPSPTDLDIVEELLLRGADPYLKRRHQLFFHSCLNATAPVILKLQCTLDRASFQDPLPKISKLQVLPRIKQLEALRMRLQSHFSGQKGLDDNMEAATPKTKAPKPTRTQPHKQMERDLWVSSGVVSKNDEVHDDLYCYTIDKYGISAIPHPVRDNVGLVYVGKESLKLLHQRFDDPQKAMADT